MTDSTNSSLKYVWNGSGFPGSIGDQINLNGTIYIVLGIGPTIGNKTEISMKKDDECNSKRYFTYDGNIGS